MIKTQIQRFADKPSPGKSKIKPELSLITAEDLRTCKSFMSTLPQRRMNKFPSNSRLLTGLEPSVSQLS